MIYKNNTVDFSTGRGDGSGGDTTAGGGGLGGGCVFSGPEYWANLRNPCGGGYGRGAGSGEEAGRCGKEAGGCGKGKGGGAHGRRHLYNAPTLLDIG